MIMEFDPTFSTSEVKSWLENLKFHPDTIQRISVTETLDGDDLVGIYKDDSEIRVYFPIFKERRRFKEAMSEVLNETLETSRTSGGSSINLIDSPIAKSTPSTPSSSKSTPDTSRSTSPTVILESPIENEPDENEKETSKVETPKSSLPYKPKMMNWISKFELPTRFSASVEMGIQSQSLNTNMVNEMIRDICTNLLSYSDRPNKAERVQVAKMVINKYPFMADKAVLDGATPWGSMEIKIFNRMKKLQKTKRKIHVAGLEEEQTNAPKKTKRSPKEDLWSIKPQIPEGETLESLKAQADSTWQETKTKPKDVKLNRNFMERTYCIRRHEILDNPCPVDEVLGCYPPLRQFIHIRAEFCRIFANEDLSSDLHDKFSKVWQPKILNYAEKAKEKEMSNLMQELEVALATENIDATEFKCRAAFMGLNFHLKVKSGKKHSYQDKVFTVLERESPIDEEIAHYIQPQIVAVGELFDMDNLYIVCEGKILCVIPHKRITDAILALLASFYIFNMEYKEGSNILSFLEQALLGISRGKPRLSVSSFFNALSNA